MKSAALAVILVAAAAPASHAGTYVGLGIGSSADVGGQMSNFGGGFGSDGSRSGRLILGYRFGRLSVEGNATRFGLLYNNNLQDEITTLSAAAKLSFPVESHFEAFGAVGLERSWLSAQISDQDMSGNGYLLGAGFEYRVDLGLGGSIFVDYTRSDTSFQNSRMHTLDGTASMWTLGLTLSI